MSYKRPLSSDALAQALSAAQPLAALLLGWPGHPENSDHQAAERERLVKVIAWLDLAAREYGTYEIARLMGVAPASLYRWRRVICAYGLHRLSHPGSYELQSQKFAEELAQREAAAAAFWKN